MRTDNYDTGTAQVDSDDEDTIMVHFKIHTKCECCKQPLPEIVGFRFIISEDGGVHSKKVIREGDPEVINSQMCGKWW